VTSKPEFRKLAQTFVHGGFKGAVARMSIVPLPNDY